MVAAETQSASAETLVTAYSIAEAPSPKPSGSGAGAGQTSNATHAQEVERSSPSCLQSTEGHMTTPPSSGSKEPLSRPGRKVASGEVAL